jgi:hypothetical protein
LRQRSAAAGCMRRSAGETAFGVPESVPMDVLPLSMSYKPLSSLFYPLGIGK